MGSAGSARLSLLRLSCALVGKQGGLAGAGMGSGLGEGDENGLTGVQWQAVLTRGRTCLISRRCVAMP